MPLNIDGRGGGNYGNTAQIVYPLKGKVKLLDQNEVLQNVLHRSFRIAIKDMYFNDAYPTVPSCTALGRSYLLDAARECGIDAADIKRRLKEDPVFAGDLADQVPVFSLCPVV
jgi:hypothetical protein